MTETETIARNLAAEIARHRKTQYELAAELGMSTKTLGERLQGRGAFTTDQLSKAAAMFDMSLYQLMLKLLEPIDGINQIRP